MYVVCEEIINGRLSKCYSIRVESDCCPSRFVKHKAFEDYEDANDFIHKLREHEKANDSGRSSNG